MAIEKDNAHEVAGNWAPPNVEGKDPHAAFSLFLVHVKKILRPAELGYLLRPLMQPLTNKEMSIIDIRDALREICGAELTIVQDRLAALTTAVEVYAKANRLNPFLFERLGWMVHGVTIWEPHILAPGDITFTNEEHLKELSEGFRMDERYKEAGISADEKAMEVAFADGFVNAVFRTDELRAEVVERLKGIATSIAVDPIPTNRTTATQRVTWTDTAALLAYLLTELIEANYITPPPNGRRTGKDGNRAAVADLAYQLLDIRDRSTGELVTREYFRSLMRPSSPDRDSRVDLFRIRPRVARNGPT